MIIVLVGTGTAGHVYAAQALAETLIKEGHNVHFMASQDGMENQLLADLSLPVYRLFSRPFFGVSFFGRLLAAFSLFSCFWQARKKLITIQADMVLGFGGHVSAACILAARSAGISTALHEANAVAGFGNRLVRRLVQQVYLGSLACDRVFRDEQVLCTGLPVRNELLVNVREPRIAVSNKKSAELSLLILGGSNGASFLNKNIAPLVAILKNKGMSLRIIHQAGEKDVEHAKAAYSEIELQATIVGYSKDMRELYNKADFVISSAGAGTLAELCLWGIPCFLVPLAIAAENHQEANAQEFARLTGCAWVREADWNTEKVAEQILALLNNQQAYKQQSEGMLCLARPEAATKIAHDILQQIN